MEKFLKHIACFFIPPILLYIPFAIFALPALLKITNGPSTKEKILYSFEHALKREYDLLILGNSRIYRGINPDKLGIAAYNFSHDHDTYNQLYYKLDYLLKNGKRFHYLILGVDYFQFNFFADTRNYIYGRILADEYLADYPSSITYYEFQYYLDLLNPTKLSHLKGVFNKNKPFVKENGQFVLAGKARKSDYAERSIQKRDIQIQYFERILEDCKENNIKVFLTMLPIRKNELNAYPEGEMKDFDSFLSAYLNESVVLVNFTHDQSYSWEDYTDLTHFNQAAADRFSAQLNDTIMSLIKTLGTQRK